MQKVINVIGAGLAGSEAALYLADRGVKINLYDIKGTSLTDAHHSHDYAELVCSNSLKSSVPTSASGMLKQEMTALGSRLIPIAADCAVPAGGALAVDREIFSNKITSILRTHANVTCHSAEVSSFEDGHIYIVATGPLTTEALSCTLAKILGEESLFFFDAASPIITTESIDMGVAFSQNRYQKGEPDYINCPFDRDQYDQFYDALVSAETVQLKDFEHKNVFEGCMPIEVLAKRGKDAIRYGPMKPMGLLDPRTDRRPYAAVQLRRENMDATMYNLVGFQTNLTISAQRSVFTKIPGLKNAAFLRYGVMHKNTYLNFPKSLDKFSRLKSNPNIFIAGQLSGVEGYVESMASGLLCAVNVLRFLQIKDMITLSSHTVLGGMYNYLINANIDKPQPINANLGLLTPIEERDKTKKGAMYALRSAEEMSKIIKILKE